MATLHERVAGLENTLSDMADLLNILVEEVDADTVRQKMVQVKMGRAKAHVEKAKTELAKAVAEKQIVTIKSVKPGCIVTCTEYDKEGNEVFPGYAQVTFEGMKPEIQAQMKGKLVGAKIKLPDDSVFEITGIYEPKKIAKGQPKEATS